MRVPTTSSLRARLLLAVGLLAVAAVVAVAIAARQSTRVEFGRFQQVEKKLDETGAPEALARVAAVLDGACCDADATLRARAAAGPDEAWLVTDATGTVIAAAGFDSDAAHLRVSVSGDDMRIEGTHDAGATSGMLALMIRGGPRRMIRQANGQPARLVLIALPAAAAQPAAQFLGSVDRRLIAATGFVAALALAATWWLTRRLTQPLSELREAARDLALGQLSRRVATGGTDEVADLARGFNAMAAELERQRQLRRDLVHDVAHELRAPLTALRCRVEAAIDGVSPDPGRSLRELNEDVQHLSQLVSDLEDLAHAEAREIRLALAEVRLDDVCQSALRAAKLDADPRVRTAFAPDLTAHGDVVRIRQIVVNLLTNANRHTPHDGRITLRTVSRDGMAAIDVHNTGSALSPDELRRVFDRFYRADPSRQRATGGSGLGLAIVKHLAEAQGGRVWAASDEDGVTFGVALPPGRR